MRSFKYIWVIGLTVTLLLVAIPVIIWIPNEPPKADDPWAGVADPIPHTDHTDLITDPLTTGPEVTAVCLDCHEEAGHEMIETVHWTWKGDPVLLPGRDEPVSIGKANQINNYCIGIQGNEVGCSRCHAGYGWEDETFDFSQEQNVDCLVCHADTGLYSKSAAGRPAEGVDLVAAAQSVGSPTRQNCGSCHFNGGGGNAVKHGDMDESLYFPSEDIDVHMGRYDFQCVTCHKTENHEISGRAISVSVDNENQIACADCHNTTLHEDDRVNDHVDTVACQTCHIPEGALREPTKMDWDWSTAGQDIPEDPHVYLRIKGSFVYERNFMPDYIWYNGTADRYLLGDLIDPSQPTQINEPLGNIDDPTAMIWPFKVHNGNQIYDSENNYLIQPKTVGEDGYWSTFNWQLAAELGAVETGMVFSGSYDFAPTQMYWNLSHMVQPKENALQCTDCHGEDGRMDWEALGYYGDPMEWGGRDQFSGAFQD